MAEVLVHSLHDSNHARGTTDTISGARPPVSSRSRRRRRGQQNAQPTRIHSITPIPQLGPEQVETHHISVQNSQPSRATIDAERILMTQPMITNHDDHGAQAHVTVVINPMPAAAPLSPRNNQNRRRRKGGRRTSEISQHNPDPNLPATAEGTSSSTYVSDASCDEAAVKRPNTIYEQHLVTKGLGFPLWTPQPNMHLAKEYRVKGAMIGDVGIITKNGAFDFWFNICLARTDSINPPDLPEGFQQLQLNPEDTRGFREFTARSHLTSSTVKQAKHAENSRRGTTFESSAAEGAVLSMPNGAYHEELNNIASFREYMATHVESWYQWAKRRGREVQNGDIRLVIGHDKATSWGMACFANTSRHQRCSLTFSQDEESERATGCPYAWEHTGTSVDVKAGPDQWDTQDLRQSNDPPLLNQCLFLRTLNALLSDDLWTSMQMHGAPALNVQGSPNGSCNAPKSPEQNSTDTSETSFSSRTTNSTGQDQAPSQRRSQHEEERSYPEDTEYALRHSHPSYAINAWLLKETEIGRVLKPKMVITDDSVWGALGSMVDALLDLSEDPGLANRCFDQVLKSHNIEAIRSNSSVIMYLNPKDSTGQAHAQGLARVPALMGVSRENDDDNSSYSVVPIKSTANVEAFIGFVENTKGIVFGPARENSIILVPLRHYIKGTASYSHEDEARLHSGSHSPTEFVLDLCSVFHLQNRRLHHPIDLCSLLKALPIHRNLDFAATLPGIKAYLLKRSNSLASDLQPLHPLPDDGNDHTVQDDRDLVSPLYDTGGGFRRRSLYSRQMTNISILDKSEPKSDRSSSSPFPLEMNVRALVLCAPLKSRRRRLFQNNSRVMNSSLAENNLDGYAEHKKRTDDAYRMIVEYHYRDASVDNGTKVASDDSGPSPASIDAANQSAIYPRRSSKQVRFAYAYKNISYGPIIPPPLTSKLPSASAGPVEPPSPHSFANFLRNGHDRESQVGPALRSNIGRGARCPSLTQGHIVPPASLFIRPSSRLYHLEGNQRSHTENAPPMRFGLPLAIDKHVGQDGWKEERVLSQAEFCGFPISSPQERQGQSTLFTQEVWPIGPNLFRWQCRDRSTTDRPRSPQNSLEAETRGWVVQRKPDTARCTEHSCSDKLDGLEVIGTHQEFDCVPQFYGFDANSSFDDPQNPGVLVMSAEHRRFSVATEQRKTEKEPSFLFRTM